MKDLNFKRWVESHNPTLEWDWKNPIQLKKQLIDTISESGDIQLKELFELFFYHDDPGLSFDETNNFLKTKY